MNEVVDGVQQVLLLALQRGVVGGDFEELLLQLADDGRLPEDQSQKLLLFISKHLQLHLPLLLHLVHLFLQKAAERKTVQPCFSLCGPDSWN